MPLDEAQEAVAAEEADWRTREGERFLTVGIGASAGGLEAFERFLGQLPTDDGLTYVLVQHLSPEHESSLPEILSRATPLPVELARDRQRIERGHVYVIPPGTGLIVEGGILRFVAPDRNGTRLAVNAFLTSLAEDQRGDAVGVVLSGTGSDGALGIAAVKRHGGRTFAQLPAEAKYESMPAAAIATGMVDRVLPVEGIASALLELAAERRRHPPESMHGEEVGVRQALDAVARTTGHDFTRYKRSTILRRFHRRMAATGIATVREYATRLERDEEEVRCLADDLTINVTAFFRDEEPFQALERIVAPDVLERRRVEGVRIWVPGCSSGEEAYSIAMLFREQMDGLPRSAALQLFATDIDASALAEARRGHYPGAIERQVSRERLSHFFTRRGDGYAVTRALRDLCIFTEHDLVRDPPFSRMDLVTCRNLLIYLEPALQKRVIELLHYALRPGGYLLLGKAEMIDTHDLELFEIVDKTHRVFRRREVSRRPAVLPPERRAPASAGPAPQPRRGEPEVKSAADRSRNIVLEEYAPASVVVDGRGEIRYLWGAKLSVFLPPRAGPPVTNLMHAARRELRVELSAALHNAARQGKPVTYKDVQMDAEGVRRMLNIVVRPLPPAAPDPDELFLVVFEELQAAPLGEGEPLDAPTLERHRQLERDLESTQERLQATIDELENANEALRTTNEQLQSMNEEMHSSNEELQTSQEELQSVNEELNTLNAELSKKVDELELLYGDLQNLFQSTQIATIFLDRQSRIARFTPAANTVFRLAAGDVGRPLSDFAARFDAQDVPDEVDRVLRTLEPVERTVGLANEQRQFLMRMHPYRTPSDVIAGVVVSFIDITKLKDTEAALRHAVEERQRAEEALREADQRKDEFLAVLSHELRNPLAPIRSSLHVLERMPADAGSGAATRAHEIMARQVGHLSRLVDDLLDVTRISKGKLQVERRPMDLRELSQRTADDHRSLFTSRGVEFAVALPDGPLWIEGDATRLAQVIGNLLQNAAKFTSRGDSVRMTLEVHDGFAVLRVRDTGIGVESAVIPRLFQPFAQAATTIDRRLGGLGLGLALVKGLVETHEGTIDLSSGGKGTGTVLVVRLPLASAPVDVEVARAPARRHRRVLVIEDNVDAAESLQMALELEGHEVVVAHDGPQGIARAREVTPEVVLCDIGLPGMDGYAVAKALRRERGLRHAFLVALTGYALPEDQRRAAESGFDAHLTKPATVAALQEVIGRAPHAADA
jgi:two-component system, chemotaxis family, CheB/CheR fusion protein